MKRTLNAQRRAEEQRQNLYCQRMGFRRIRLSHICPAVLRSGCCRVNLCRFLDNRAWGDWFDHPRIFRHGPTKKLVLTLQPYIHQDLGHYFSVVRRVRAFAQRHDLGCRISLVESWYVAYQTGEVVPPTCLIELWGKRK